ncbi:hypothetical protein [Actinosynnema sp. NPDC020468]|uniref:hypothetical protein n=1 Tax=Actinosynnema sp. NPDC020468 TaxID=3154488 RepID=UPI0033D15774
MVTAWDGYARVDYLPNPGRLQVTLHTVETTVYRRLRPGLACAFVSDDMSGPPAFVEVDVGVEPGYDASVLLRGRLLTVARELIGPGQSSRATRLRLDELAELARTWAPYRAFVLAPEPTAVRRTGSWARGLWALFDGLRLAEALLRYRPAAVLEHRGSESIDEDTADWHPLVLPEELARAAGVAPRARWTVYRDETLAGDEEIGLVVEVVGTSADPPDLVVGLDDGTGRWVDFRPGSGATRFSADVPLAADAPEPSLRFRTRGEDR